MEVERDSGRPHDSLKALQPVKAVSKEMIRDVKHGGQVAGWQLGILIVLILVAVSKQSIAVPAMLLGPGASTSDLARGKYIVDHVAMCVECHTPRNERGELIASKYLRGAPIPVAAPRFSNAQIKWAVQAPAIAGFTGYDKEQGIRLLTDGITRDGRSPDPPMPRFRLNRADAEAVVEYLKSIP